jgi:Mg/Co/Ni transporter MgtE
MSSDIAVFDRSVTVRDCLAQLRTLPETLRGAAFVVEKEKRLIGVVDIARLLAASDESGIDVAVRMDIKRLSPFARLVSIMALPAWDTALFLPVVDSKGQLLGALHFDALREGMKSEQRNEAERPMSQLLVHMAEALLVCAAGVLQAPSGKAVLSRSTGTPEV